MNPSLTPIQFGICQWALPWSTTCKNYTRTTPAAVGAARWLGRNWLKCTTATNHILHGCKGCVSIMRNVCDAKNYCHCVYRITNRLCVCDFHGKQGRSKNRYPPQHSMDMCVYVVDGKEIELCSTDDMSSSTRQIKGFPLVFIGFLCTVFGLSNSPANTIWSTMGGVLKYDWIWHSDGNEMKGHFNDIAWTCMIPRSRMPH